ncbi:hypothetical protein FXW78_55070 [Rhodococcus opacus]|nr:hypothetical protein [Rhodococcus opacus]
MTTSPKVTKTNPTGIVNFDVSEFAQLPEWQELAQAMNRMALAADGAGIGTQAEWIRAVTHLATAVGFMDWCPQCARTDETGEFVDPSAAPAVTDIADKWVRGGYICRNGHVWRCGHSLQSHRHF